MLNCALDRSISFYLFDQNNSISMADFEARKKHLIAELEETLQSPCYFDLRFLNEKFELDLEYPEEADQKVFDLWNHHQDRPCYKDFKENWALDGDRSKGEDRATVEYRYIFWLTEIKLLERVAEWRGIHLQRVKGKLRRFMTCIAGMIIDQCSTRWPRLSADGIWLKAKWVPGADPTTQAQISSQGDITYIPS